MRAGAVPRNVTARLSRVSGGKGPIAGFARRSSPTSFTIAYNRQGYHKKRGKMRCFGNCCVCTTWPVG